MQEIPKDQRQQEIKYSSYIWMCTNLFLFECKLVLSIISGSVSILSDAFNNLSDLFNSIATFVSAYLAEKPADKTHPYGLGRAEYIATQLVSFFFLYVGITLFFQSINQINNPKPLDISISVYVILTLSIILKGWMMIINRRIAKKTKSDLIDAVVVDSRNDALSAILLLAAMILQPRTSLPVDGVAGVILSIVILYQGVEILRKSMSKLLGKKLSQEMISEIGRIINKHPAVLGYHNFKGHDYGPNHIHVSVDLELPDTTDLNTAHKIVDSIEREIYQSIKVYVVAHIDPISSDKDLNKEMYEVVKELSKDIFDTKRITKFSCVKGHYRTSIFVTLDIKENEEFKQIKSALLAKAKKDTPSLSFHVESKYGENYEE